MADTEYYEALLYQKRNQLRRQQDQQRAFANRAQEIGRIYDRMAQEKGQLREKRERFRAFHNERYERFRGVLFDQKYIRRTKEILDGYDLLLRQIDANMDALNRERMRCENGANECMGLIGTLKSGINYLYRTIQNMTN